MIKHPALHKLSKRMLLVGIILWVVGYVVMAAKDPVPSLITLVAFLIGGGLCTIWFAVGIQHAIKTINKEQVHDVNKEG